MSMKDSGVKWIGQIPQDWDLIKIGSIFKCRNEKVNDTDYPPLSVTRNGIVPQMENVAKTDANDNRKMVKANDFVINSRSDRKQSCGVSDLEGSVSLINTVLFTENNDVIIPEFTNLILKNYGFAEEFYRWGHGIVADLWTTRWQEMKSIILPIPPIDIQSRIVRVLDKKISIVETLIANQQVQIEKLKKYKQAVITETVTKGLDKTVPMKDSGVEWIGQIPEDWCVKPIKSLFSFGKGLPITKADLRPSGIKTISYGQVHAKYNKSVFIDEQLYRFVESKYLQTNADSLVKKGDFIFADTSEDIEGSGDFVYIDIDDLVFAGYHSLVLKSLSNFENKYLAYLFMSSLWKRQLWREVYGIKVFSITRSLISKTTVILPTLTKQQVIVNYLDKKCADIDSLISIKQQKIEKLQEYKKSLIFEYVTGKKEVC